MLLTGSQSHADASNTFGSSHEPPPPNKPHNTRQSTNRPNTHNPRTQPKLAKPSQLPKPNTRNVPQRPQRHHIHPPSTRNLPRMPSTTSLFSVRTRIPTAGHAWGLGGVHVTAVGYVATADGFETCETDDRADVGGSDLIVVCGP